MHWRFIQWVVVVGSVAFLLSVANRSWVPQALRSSARQALLLGGILSVSLFPVFFRYPLEGPELLLAGIITGKVGASFLEGWRSRCGSWLTRHWPTWKPEWLPTKEQPQFSAATAGAAIPPGGDSGDGSTSVELAEAVQRLPQREIPPEVRMELSWLHLEQGNPEAAREEARLALAATPLEDGDTTASLRRWLRYLRCYQDMVAEGAYHVRLERTPAQVKQKAWERYQSRKAFWEAIDSEEEQRDPGTSGHQHR